jgi:hypothetical protein
MLPAHKSKTLHSKAACHKDGQARDLEPKPAAAAPADIRMRRIIVQPVPRGRPNPSAGHRDVRCVFRLLCPDADAVCLVGTFNEWSTVANPMSRAVGNRWETAIQLPPGVHEYAYVIAERAIAGEEPGAALFQGLVINEGSTILVPTR